MDGFPHHFQINLEITMCNPVAHGVNDCPRYLWMFGGKCCVVAFDVVSCFTDDLEITYYRILGLLVIQEGYLSDR